MKHLSSDSKSVLGPTCQGARFHFALQLEKNRDRSLQK